MKHQTRLWEKTSALFLCLVMLVSTLAVFPAAESTIENLYDKQTAFAGYVDPSNVEKYSPSHYTTAYIPVKAGDVITFGPCNPVQNFYLHGFDNNKHISDSTVRIAKLKEVDSFGNFNILSYTVPSNVAYIRIANASAINDIFVVTKNNAFTVKDFYNYWNFDTNTAFATRFGCYFEPKTQGALIGKSALFVGDSISCGSQEGSLYYRAWAGRIGTVNKMDYVNASVSGASCSTTRVSNRIVSQLMSNADRVFDYVILHGGVNDAWDNCRVGTVSEGFNPTGFDISTFAGGLEEMFYQANRLFPNARLGYIINFMAPRCEKGTVSDMSQYVAVAKKICEKWDIPYLNLYENEDFCYNVLRVESDVYLPDYIHPNAGGYDLLYPVIEAWMEQIPEKKFSLDIDDSAIKISTEADMKQLASHSTGNFVLTNDITLTEKWTPIPTFSGILDGKGYTIRGLDIVDAANTNWSNSGLIASLEGGTVKNLTLYGNISNNVASHSVQIGAFAGQAKNAVLSNCRSYVNITTGNASGTVYVGGLVGVVSKNTNLKMTGCANYGTVNATCAASKYTNVGGVIGTVSGNATLTGVCNYGDVSAPASSNDRGQTGGMVCATDTTANGSWVTFENCKNYGSVNSNGYSAGFVAIAQGKVTATSCYNYGTVNDTNAYAAGFVCYATAPVIMNRCINFGDVTVKGVYLGGLIARAVTDSGNCNVHYCANIGNLTGTHTGDVFYGQIVGRNQGSKGIFSNCLATGTYKTSAPSGFIGGISGSEGKNSFLNCFTTYEKVFGYGNAATSTEGSAVITSETDLTAVLAVLNSGAETPAYRLNNGELEPIYDLNAVPTTVIGTQSTAVKDGKYSVRFVSVINSLDYTAAGFRISAVITQADGTVVRVEEKTYDLHTVYEMLNANVNGEIKALNALYGTYYMALSMNNIPADCTVEYSVTSFAKNGDALTDGETVTVCYRNGETV